MPAASGTAMDIDDQGRVVGQAVQALTPSTTQDVPAMYAKGKTFHLGAPSGGLAMGMNDNLQVVGSYQDEEGLQQAFRWHGRVGLFETLPTVPGESRVATAIANDGTVVGFTSTPSGFRPFRMVDGEIERLPKTFNRTFANDINDLGVIVGRERLAGKNVAIKWQSGVKSQLKGTIAADGQPIDSVANAVSNSGAIVGRLGDRAVMWTVIGGVIEVANPTSWPSEALDVNKSSQVVGTVTTSWSDYAFVYPGSSALDLLIDQSLPWHLEQAVAISDKGWITGNGTYAGESRVFLLVPWGQLYTTGFGGTLPVQGSGE